MQYKGTPESYEEVCSLLKYRPRCSSDYFRIWLDDFDFIKEHYLVYNQETGDAESYCIGDFKRKFEEVL